MRHSRKAFVVGILAASAAFAACGDDDNIVRTRPDGGADATVDGAPVEGGGAETLSCGLPVPATYDSPTFAANAKEELDLKGKVLAIGAKMKSAEGATPMPVTTADLTAIFTSGTPSLRFVATAFAQTTVDTYLMQFGDAATKTWTPADVDAEGGAATGGKYENASIVSPTGVDLREATEKVLVDGALYNYALQLAGGVVTEATVDRLLALFGASPALVNSPGADAGAEENELIAAYAAQRDNKLPQSPGPYRKIARALRRAKAAAKAGAMCRDDLDAALKIYFLEWEKAAYLTVIYSLNQSATNLTATPQKGRAGLSAYGAALGFAQSFKGIPQDRRKITDTDIDSLLTRIGASAPYQLVLHPERALQFTQAYSDIGTIYGLTPTEIEDAKKAY